MKIRHHEIASNTENPFAECKLGREPYAKVLTDIVNTYADGFVLAINNVWGTGKTTFVKMWQQHLKNEGFQTIYFNAWENDFDDNPMVAIMSELKTLVKIENEDFFNNIIKKGAIIGKKVLPVVMKSLLKKIAGIKTDEITEALADGTSEVLSSEIDEYINRKQTVSEFRTELEEFIRKTENEKPLIFFVDELDRCRPDYAVEVLEHVKHFFSVHGIVFVLSIDKKHLASSVKGFYGSDLIDSNEYLRRFIDLEYSIPAPQINVFNEYLYEYYDFNNFFSSKERKEIPAFQNDAEFLLKIANILFIKTDATLRQQERIFALTRLILCSVKSDQHIFPDLLFVLVYLQTMQNDIFQKIERNEFTLQELSNTFFEIINSEKKTSDDFSMLYIESLLLWFYNNDRNNQDKINLLEKDESNNMITSIKSKLESENDRLSLVQYFEHIAQQRSYSNLGLKYLIKKINLTESIKIQ